MRLFYNSSEKGSHLKWLLKTCMLFSMLTLALSCTRPEEQRYRAETPENLMEREDFIAILADMLLAEAATSQNFDFTESKIERFEKYRNNIFAHYEIDSLDFFQNYDYYMTHPKLAEIIIIRARDSVRAKQEAMFAADSLKETKKQKKTTN
jgi:hypothetical protein